MASPQSISYDPNNLRFIKKNKRLRKRKKRMVSFFWQKGFYFNGRLFFFSNNLLVSLQHDLFGINKFFIRLYLMRIEDFTMANFSINTRNIFDYNVLLRSLKQEHQFLLSHFMTLTFPVLLSVKQQVKYNMLKLYLTRTSRGLSLKFDKPISRKSRYRTFSKSTPKAHLRKQAKTSSWFKIVNTYFIRTPLLHGQSGFVTFICSLRPSALSYIINIKHICNFFLNRKVTNSPINFFQIPKPSLQFTPPFLISKFGISFVSTIHSIFKITQRDPYSKTLTLFIKKWTPNYISNTNQIKTHRIKFFYKKFWRPLVSTFLGSSISSILQIKLREPVVFPKPHTQLLGIVKNLNWIEDLCSFLKLSQLPTVLTILPKAVYFLSQKFCKYSTSHGLFKDKPIHPPTKIKKQKSPLFDVNKLAKHNFASTPLVFSFLNNKSWLSGYSNPLSVNATKLSKLFTSISHFSKSKIRLKKLRNFRLSQSEIMNTPPLRRKIINYNLTNITTLETLINNPFNQSRFFSKFHATLNFIKNEKKTTSIFFNSFLDRGFMDPLNYFNTKLSFSSLRRVSGRIKTVWVSKVTQLMLDPFRREFMSLYRKNLKYQKRITKYILLYYRFKVLESIQNVEFRLTSTLVKVRFASDLNNSIFLINSGLVYVNGIQVNSLSYSIYFFDLIQLQLSYRFLLYIKWLNLTFSLKLKRFLFFVRFWRRRSFRPFPKQSSYRIPYWVKNNLFFQEPAPLYAEISIFSFSCIITYAHYFNTMFYSFFSFNEAPFASVRALNWKSIT